MKFCFKNGVPPFCWCTLLREGSELIVGDKHREHHIKKVTYLMFKNFICIRHCASNLSHDNASSHTAHVDITFNWLLWCDYADLSNDNSNRPISGANVQLWLGARGSSPFNIWRTFWTTFQALVEILISITLECSECLRVCSPLI